MVSPTRNLALSSPIIFPPLVLSSFKDFLFLLLSRSNKKRGTVVSGDLVAKGR